MSDMLPGSNYSWGGRD